MLASTRRSQIRSVSTTISYLLLVIGVLAVEILLVALVLPIVTGTGGSTVLFVRDLSEHAPRGYYSIFVYNCSGRFVPSLYVVITNPSNHFMNVYILADVVTRGTHSRVIYLLEDADVFWLGQTPATFRTLEGNNYVKVVMLQPGGTVSFIATLDSGIVPRRVLACTRGNCYTLREVSLVQKPLDIGEAWRIGQWRIVNGTIHQQWSWVATVLTVTQQCCSGGTCVNISRCCEQCPPGTTSSTVLNIVRQCGEFYTGSLLTTSLAWGLPANVIAGFYTTDPAFSFSVPRKNVSVGGVNHTVYGFNSSALQYYDPVVEIWRSYQYQECLNRTVVIYGGVFADPEKRYPLSTLFQNASRISVFVATRGFREPSPLRMGRFRDDTVNVTIRVVLLNGSVVHVGSLVAHPTTSYTETVFHIAHPLSSIAEIQVIVTYTMIGERAVCSQSCGATYTRHVRLAFYVELIPRP